MTVTASNMSEPTLVLPPGSRLIRGDHGIMAWTVEPAIVGDYLLGEYVHIQTPDQPDHLNKVGKIAGMKSDGSYTLRLVGVAEPDNGKYRLLGSRERPTTCVQMFPEDFRRICRSPMLVQHITGKTHALGAFMQCVESLV